MSETIPAGRMPLRESAARLFAALYRLATSNELDHRIADLVKVRASQINGCAFCIDMHWKDAAAAGETDERLYSLDAWRECPLYSERERAALELCDAMTLIADTHVPDENRLMITTRVEPGHYQPALREVA
jgi:AhpD family alkylhydroperoxidase